MSRLARSFPGLHTLHALLPQNDGLKSDARRSAFHVLLDVTKLCLSLAENLLNLALCFPGLIAHELSGDFFDLAFRFFDAALNSEPPRNHQCLISR